QANQTKAHSARERTKVQLIDAQTKYARAKELSARSLLPQSDLDSAKIAVDTAQAMLASQQATVAQTQAAVSQSQASVNQNQVNLDHTIIEAPIDGIVTQRSVDVGQTVAASMQAPNQQLKLKPGMTANVKVEIAKRSDVLRVANAALRFRPTAEIFAALNQQVPPEAQPGGNRGGRGGQGRTAQGAPSASPQSGQG